MKFFFIDNIEHIKDLIGVDYIGIGSNYEANPNTPIGLEDVSRFPHLFAAMVKPLYLQHKKELKEPFYITIQSPTKHHTILSVLAQ